MEYARYPPMEKRGYGPPKLENDGEQGSIWTVVPMKRRF